MIEPTLKALRNVTKFSNEQIYEKTCGILHYPTEIKAKIIGKSKITQEVVI